MTIDSGWIYSLKCDVPSAFTAGRPFWPKGVFVDGQIKLNTPLLEHTQTWDEYINRQFLRPVQRYFEQQQVECVILAFDNYALVPNAKGMTQSKRRKHVPNVDFSDRDALPPTVPKGEDWIAHLCNRTFKAKLIDMIIYYLVKHLTFPAAQMLIIDYVGHPKKYVGGNMEHPEDLTNLVPLGEADVKFTRYTAFFDKLQVDSIDGDSVPIALMHMQKELAAMRPPPRISVLRMTTRITAEAPVAKRPVHERKSKKEYEYLDITRLYVVLVSEILPQCVSRATLPLIEGHEISMLIAMIGLAGTDFTRKLSGVTAKSLYDYLPLLWLRLSTAYDPETNSVRVGEFVDHVVAHIYRNKFTKHVRSSLDRLHLVLRDLEESKLSDKVKQGLQSYETIECTVRNINWLLQYWSNGGTYPDPVQEQYGFKRKASGAVDYVA